MAAEFDLEEIGSIGEGEKTAEEIEEIIDQGEKAKKGKEEEKPEVEMIEVKRSKKRKRKHVTCYERHNINIYRKAYSENNSWMY